MEVGGFEIGDDGHLGGFEALRLIRFVFLGFGERWRGDRMLAVAREGDLSPRWGFGFMGEKEPSAHALGYLLAALRAWGHGLEKGRRARALREPRRRGRPSNANAARQRRQ